MKNIFWSCVPHYVSAQSQTTRMTESHCIDVRLKKGGALIIPNDVRAMQINASARAKLGGLEKHTMHTNNPNEFLQDIVIAGMTIFMPLHENIFKVEDTHKKIIETNADRVNDYISEISLLRNKPTIASDCEKTFIKQGYSFDQRTLYINGDHLPYTDIAEKGRILSWYRKARAEEAEVASQVAPLTRGKLKYQEQLTLEATALIRNLAPNTPILPVAITRDVISPNQKTLFVQGKTSRRQSGAAAATIADRTNVAREMATRRLILAQTDYRDRVDVSPENIKRAKKKLEKDSIGKLFKILLSDKNIELSSDLRKIKKISKLYGLSAHNYEAIALREEEAEKVKEQFLMNLFETSGAVWTAHNVDTVKEQIDVYKTLSMVFEPQGKRPMYTTSKGDWQKLRPSEKAQDTSVLMSSPY